MISNISSFERYQKEKVWPSDKQALTRARDVAGDAMVREKFGSIRKSIRLFSILIRIYAS